MTLNCPASNNDCQKDIETAHDSYAYNVQQQAAFQQELNDALNKLDNVWHGGGSDKNRPQDKDAVDWAFMQCCQVIFPLILDVSTAQQNCYASSEDVSSSVGALVAQVQDLEAKGANADPNNPSDTTKGMTPQDAQTFYEASADLQWDLNCTSYSYTDGTVVQGNYLSGAMDDDSRAQISTANESIMGTYGINTTSYIDPVTNTAQANANFGKLTNSSGQDITYSTIATQSNTMWTSQDTDKSTDAPKSGQAMDPRQTNMNDRFSTEGTICNSTEQTFNMRLQYTITNTNTDMSTESEIEKSIIDGNDPKIKAQKSG